MSGPIKPPGGGPPGPSGPDGADGAGKPQSVDGPSEAFRETLERTDQASEAGASEAPPQAEGIQAVADDLRAGRIDTSEAVERLVQRALESQAAEALPPAMRAELEQHIRRALADDPSLAALTKDLERGG